MSHRKVLVSVLFLMAAGGFAFRCGERQVLAAPCVKPPCVISHAWWNENMKDAVVDPGPPPKTKDFSLGCAAVFQPGVTWSDCINGKFAVTTAFANIDTGKPPMGGYTSATAQLTRVYFGNRKWDCDIKATKARTCETVGTPQAPGGAQTEWVCVETGSRTKGP